MRQIVFLLMLLVSADVWATEQAGLLVYKVWESGLDPYISRILVTPQHVRLDEGQEQGGFTLFQRKQGTIYNVSHEDETVLIMPASKIAPTPEVVLQLSEKLELDSAAPLVAGRQPRQLDLFSNGELCRALVTIEGVMDDALVALAEFRRALAQLQIATLSNATPTVCEQSEFLYASDRSLKFGLPLSDSYMGKRQLLMDFKQHYTVAPELFLVPNSYREISIPGLSAE